MDDFPCRLYLIESADVGVGGSVERRRLPIRDVHDNDVHANLAAACKALQKHYADRGGPNAVMGGIIGAEIEFAK